MAVPESVQLIIIGFTSTGAAIWGAKDLLDQYEKSKGKRK